MCDDMMIYDYMTGLQLECSIMCLSTRVFLNKGEKGKAKKPWNIVFKYLCSILKRDKKK